VPEYPQGWGYLWLPRTKAEWVRLVQTGLTHSAFISPDSEGIVFPLSKPLGKIFSGAMHLFIKE